MQIRFSEADVSGGAFIPEGEHEVTIAEMRQEVSKAGNPQLVGIFKDRFGREAKEYFPLTEKAKFKLARLAIASGLSKESLTNAGLNPLGLVNKRILLVKRLEGVRIYEGKEQKQYSQEFFPLPAGGASTEASSGVGTDDSIPF